MDPKIQAMLELERRGNLPENFAPVLAEARKRGLIPDEKKGWGQTIKENLFGDDDPNSHNFGEKVGAALNKAGEAMTFGLIGDEASAAAAAAIPGGMGYDERLAFERKNEEILERDNPGLALTAEIGGSLVAPVGALGAAAKGANLGRKALTSAAATGAMGGVYGGMEGEGGAQARMDEAAKTALLAAGAGAAIPVVGAGVQKAIQGHAGRKLVKEAVKRAPSTDELRTAGNAAYKAVDDAGVVIKPESFSKVRKEIYDALQQGGLDELPSPMSLTPKAARVNQIAGEMDEALKADPTAGLPFKSLDQFRRKAGVAASDLNKTDAALGMRTIETLDDFVKNIGPDDVLSGDAQALPGLIDKARSTWAKMSKSQLVDDAIEAGNSQYLSGSGTGLKYQFKKILRNPKLASGFSDAEKKMMARVVNGSVPEQVLRLAGSGITHIAAPMAGFAGAGGGLPGLAVGAGALGLSRGARAASDAVMNKNAEIVRALVAAGGVPNLPATVGDKSRAIIEQLMRQGSAATIQ